MRGRFDTLDAMRGLAAIVVMLHHSERLTGTHIFQAGYLAVDFFFMLSGFVIAASYEHRFATGLAPREFMWLRLKRLWPVMACGVLAGAWVLCLSGMGLFELALRFAAQLLFIPVILGSERLYVLDIVQWSLFYELVANCIHACFIKSMPRKGLMVFTAAAFVLLSWAAVSHGSVGLGDNGDTIIQGMPRALFSYGMGVLLFRSRFRVSAPGWVPIAALPAVLILVGGAYSFVPAWSVELVAVAFLLPAVLIVGAGTTIGRRAWARALGLLSYPLYAIHVPIIAGLEKVLSGPLLVPTIVISALLAAYALAVALEPGGRQIMISIAKKRSARDLRERPS